ncbi:hypothetical protein [Aeromonas sp.]|jgi:hypothetical protein|uniref:hypothetical protein n=1 Tax=Aeromonas sp. TaxID=647 RepID=UPI00258326E7|nr:hypothetical protein [Aeromonas sp.]MCX7128047.1 hypothetical protein [Aeromonas sp.]
MNKVVALKIRPSQHRLQMIRELIDEKHTVYEYDENEKPYVFYHDDDHRFLDDHLLNEMIIACKGRDLSCARLKNNQIWKLWVLDLIPDEGGELYDQIGYICEDAKVIRHKK